MICAVAFSRDDDDDDNDNSTCDEFVCVRKRFACSAFVCSIIAHPAAAPVQPQRFLSACASVAAAAADDDNSRCSAREEVC